MLSLDYQQSIVLISSSVRRSRQLNDILPWMIFSSHIDQFEFHRHRLWPSWSQGNFILSTTRGSALNSQLVSLIHNIYDEPRKVESRRSLRSRILGVKRDTATNWVWLNSEPLKFFQARKLELEMLRASRKRPSSFFHSTALTLEPTAVPPRKTRRKLFKLPSRRTSRSLPAKQGKRIRCVRQKRLARSPDATSCRFFLALCTTVNSVNGRWFLER